MSPRRICTGVCAGVRNMIGKDARRDARSPATHSAIEQESGMGRATVGMASLAAVAAVIALSPGPGDAPKASVKPTPAEVEAAIGHAAATVAAARTR